MGGGFLSKYSREQQADYRTSLLSAKNLRFYVSLMMPYRRIILAALLMALLHTLTLLMPPLLSQRIIDHHILTGDVTGMMPWLVLFFALYGASWFFAYHQRMLSQTAGQRAIFDIRERLFSKLLVLPMAFHDNQQKGALTSLMMNDVSALSSAVTDGIIGLISDLATLIGIVWIMSRLHTGLTLLLLATLPFVLLAMKLLGTHIRSAFREVREKMAELNTQVEENFAGIRVVQSMGVQQQQEQDFLQVSELNLQAGLKAMILLALIFPLSSLTTGAGNALLLWYGGLQVLQGTMTLGIFAAFLAYLRKFYQPLRNFNDLYHTYLSALASLDRIISILDEPDLLEANRLQPSMPHAFQGEILFDHVSFHYYDKPESDKLVLNNLTLHLKPGEHVGILGETGAGKSTLAALMVRLREPVEGNILFDGIPISKFQPSQLHQWIAVVPQHIFLFSGSVADNIRFGKPDATEAEIIAAAQKAKAHEMIMSLPQQYDTILGEEGSGLSGGQRQLIAFARALIKDAPVLLLDEATSSMDVMLESRVQQSMDALMHGRTALIIAHRLSTLKKLDRICILENGRLAACGSHETLLRSSHYYRQLLESSSFTEGLPINGG
jgi:ATP-binding cassette, subfamily B, multidrug efflux pump